jgi:hypothetical protein
VPSLLEFLGFIYFPAGLLAGPVVEFREYRDCADGTMYKKVHPVATERSCRTLV